MGAFRRSRALACEDERAAHVNLSQISKYMYDVSKSLQPDGKYGYLNLIFKKLEINITG